MGVGVMVTRADMSFKYLPPLRMMGTNETSSTPTLRCTPTKVLTEMWSSTKESKRSATIDSSRVSGTYSGYSSDTA